MTPMIIHFPRRCLLILAAAMLFSTAAIATHEIDHRFAVWGEVLYQDGTPIANETIELTVRDGDSIGSVTTNEDGRYHVVLHVHDQDRGKVFDMTVMGVTTKVRIEFDPRDKQTERGKRVDFTIKR